MHVCFFELKGHSSEIAGKNKVRPLFLQERFFCLVEILRFGSGVWCSDICGLGGPEILGQALPVTLLLRSSMLGVGLLMETSHWKLKLIFWRLLRSIG